ncbi:hypothetical protein Pcinc_023597, partial [Petrolisthes cinctipes]
GRSGRDKLWEENGGRNEGVNFQRLEESQRDGLKEVEGQQEDKLGQVEEGEVLVVSWKRGSK